MKTEYVFKKGAFVPAGINADSVGKELMQLKKRVSGKINPEEIVTAAEDPASAMHDWFEWDDSEAAQQHRLHQARMLLGVVRVKVTGSDTEEQEPIRAFVNIRIGDAKDRQYFTVPDAMKSPDLREKLLEQARRDMDKFCERYHELQELAEVFAAMKAA